MSQRVSTATCTRTGKSLIEIIVVIAILVMITGLLLPTYQTARTESKITRSTNNMRQIVMALRLYCEDELDNVPAVNGPTTLVDSGLIPRALLYTGGGNALGF